MTRKEKQLSRIDSSRKNVTIKELVTLMTKWGFTYKRNDHNYMFQHPLLVGKTFAAAIPHGREKKVFKRYIDNCLDAIEQLREAENEQRP